jgi:hypothetical protein
MPLARAALGEAFAAAKPSDCVVIGMYPKEKDQMAENRRLALECLSRTS